jgi:hypothetical protein
VNNFRLLLRRARAERWHDAIASLLATRFIVHDTCILCGRHPVDQWRHFCNWRSRSTDGLLHEDGNE